MTLAVATLAAYLRACAPIVAPDTMRAIVTVESRGYSYAINDNSTRTAYCVPGAQGYPCSRARAIALANAAVHLGHSVDVGIAQVNSGNFRAYRVDAAQMLEPCKNLEVGSAILEGAYRNSSAHFPERRAALWHAIMAYNTGSLYAGENYVRLVVDAALQTSTVPAVPSIAILESPPTASMRPATIASVDEHAGAHLRGIRMHADPRTAPLRARGLGSTGRRGDLNGSLEPALSR